VFYQIEDSCARVSNQQAMSGLISMLWRPEDTPQNRIDYCLLKAEEARALASAAGADFQTAYFALMRSWVALAADIETAGREHHEKAAEYRWHAQECRALARNAASEQERAQILELSATWECLAVDRENSLHTHPHLAREVDKGQDAGERSERKR
jgi:hypothetical protein